MSPLAQAMTYDFDTRYHVPGWWIKAFDYVHCKKSAGPDPFNQVGETLLTPALAESELNALLIIIASLQKQILHEKLSCLVLQTSDFLKHTTTLSKKNSFSSHRLFQELAALRFLRVDTDGFSPVPLVSRERWLKPSDAAGWTLELELSDAGHDLLLGYTLPQLELIRRIEDQPSVLELLGDDPPLLLWRSIWQEFSPLEQAVLQRLERAMQWDGCWLHFDGIFGKPLSSLMANIDLLGTSKSTASKSSSLVRFSAFLEKFGKRLCQHGLLKFEIDDEYLAVSGEEDEGVVLVWQASSQKVFTTEQEDYRNLCLDRLLLQRLRLKEKDLGDLFLAGLKDEWIRRDWQQVWERLLKIEDQRALQGVAYYERPSSPQLLLTLFVEWFARIQPGHNYPLPEELMETELVAIVRGCMREGIEEAFARFSASFSENADYARACKRLPMSSLCNQAALDSSLVATLKELRSSATRPYAMDLAPVAKINEHKRHVEGVDKDQGDEAGKTSTPAPSSNLRRIASEELNKIKSLDPEKYTQLKSSYVNSLEASRKKVLLEVQKHMQPEQFENHLRHSLVKYMVENPGLWSSAQKRPIKSASLRSH